MSRPRWIQWAVGGLIVMITWTLVVKVVAPLAWFWAETAGGRAPAVVPVMWDLWPLAHAVLAVVLWRGVGAAGRLGLRAWAFALGVAGIETAIVVTKLALWSVHPERSFWKLLWLTNKVYVLLFFLWLLALLLSPAGRPRRAVAAERRSPG